MSPPRIAVLMDYAAEGWPSMDLCGEMLAEQLEQRSDVEVERVQPEFRTRAGILLGEHKLGKNTDRVFNRYYDYPRALRQVVGRCDYFHVVDHSYSQLALTTPPERTGVFCHDLDTFRCLLEPARDPRPRWFRRLARSTLRGFTRAARVFFATHAVRDELIRHALVAPERLVHAPFGVAPGMTPAPADAPAPARRTLLHVGSSIPRKRVDLLLRVFAELRARFPDLRLVKVGAFAPEHEALIGELGLAEAIERHEGISREALIELYRQATLVLQPSDAEGFGLPLIEGLACGAVVVASALAVHEEVGGRAVVYCTPGQVAPWVDACATLLEVESAAPSRELRLARAAAYSWERHAEVIARTYLELPR